MRVAVVQIGDLTEGDRQIQPDALGRVEVPAQVGGEARQPCCRRPPPFLVQSEGRLVRGECLVRLAGFEKAVGYIVVTLGQLVVITAFVGVSAGERSADGERLLVSPEGFVRLPEGAVRQFHTLAVPDPTVDAARLAQVEARYLETCFRPQAAIEAELAAYRRPPTPPPPPTSRMRPLPDDAP